MKIYNFGGAQEFLALDYHCNILWNGKLYPSLWHALIAAMTTNDDLRTALSDNRFIMDQRIIADLWSQVQDKEAYKVKVIEQVFAKYAPNNLLNELLAHTSKDDELIYLADPTGVIGKVTMLIRNGLSLPQVLNSLLSL